MRSRNHRIAGVGLAFVLATTGALVAREDLETELTVSEPIEVPGAVLEPGDYIMELVEAQTDARAVTFRRAENNHVVATALTIDARRVDPADQTKLSFYETAAGEPPALRTWFYPGNYNGYQFVYPETRGSEIAEQSRRHVPTIPDEEFKKMKAAKDQKDPEPVLMAVKEVRVYAVSPDKQKTSVKEAAEKNRQADIKTRKPDEFVRATERPETRIERQIRKEIVTLPFYSIWDHIEYRVDDDGNVTLMGSVYRPSMRKSVERVTKNIEGVRSVENKVNVQPTSSYDDDIRRAAYRAIYGHPALQDYQLRAVPPIHIVVDNGELTLEGVVLNSMDKNIAGVQARSVPGVFEVTNNLRTET